MNMLLEDLFGTNKPVIGMVHFPPLPGSPLYDSKMGLKGILEVALKDAEILARLGYDGILFSNEGDRPYLRVVNKYTVAVMARLIEKIVSQIKIPFGVSVLADPVAAVSVAEAVEASFVRTFLSWVYVGDWGIVDPDAGKLQRLRTLVGSVCKVFANVSGHTSPLGNRTLGDIVRGAVMFGLADAVCVAGATAGAPVPEKEIVEAKQNAFDKPVLVGTGVNLQNIKTMLSLADGVIVGTSIKKDGYTFNPIDEKRAKALLEAARKLRKEV
ncbi:MAG: BtpA/SgcQ family protein [Nitrososphaeria archaeon]